MKLTHYPIVRSLQAMMSCVLVFAPSAAVSQAQTQSRHWLPDVAYVQAAGGDGTQAITAGLQWEWQTLWRPTENTRLSGYWEVSAGRWRADLDPSGRAWAWVTQLGATPMFRWREASNSHWFAEAGIGVSYLMPIFRSKDRQFSTRFNFRDQLGIGYATAQNDGHDVSLRVEHYSNAGFREPNPGLTFAGLRYAYRF